MRPTTWIAPAITIAAAALTAAGCQAVPVPVLYDGLGQERYLRCGLRADGQELYSANYLTMAHTHKAGSPATITMYSAVQVELVVNDIAYRMNPVGGEFSTSNIDGFVEKYFVDDPAELGLAAEGGDPLAPAPGSSTTSDVLEDHEDLEDLEAEPAPMPDPDASDLAARWRLDLAKPQVRSSVLNGVAAQGMTRAQVLMAIGPPAEVAAGTPAVGLSLDTILAATRWVYYTTTTTFSLGLLGKRVYVFDGDGILINVEQ
jgi:hypothetical protein